MPSQFVQDIMGVVTFRNPGEPEFHQAVQEVVESIAPIVVKHPEFIRCASWSGSSSRSDSSCSVSPGWTMPVRYR